MFGDVMRFTREVEVKQREVKGVMKSVLNNCVAISDGGDRTTFMDVSAWESTAKLIGQYLQKGDEFYAEGTLKNKTLKVEEKEIQTVYLNIEKIKFTHGNKKRIKESESQEHEV